MKMHVARLRLVAFVVSAQIGWTRGSINTQPQLVRNHNTPTDGDIKYRQRGLASEAAADWKAETAKANLRGVQATTARQLQVNDQQCWDDWLDEKKITRNVCQPVAGSDVEGFLQLMTEEVLPAVDIVGSILDTKATVGVGVDSCRCVFTMEARLEKILQKLLKSKLNPCYSSGERGANKFSGKKARSNSRVLDTLDRVLAGLSRIPVIKNYAKKIATAVKAISDKYRGAAIKIGQKCTEFNDDTIKAVEDAAKLMRKLRKAHKAVDGAARSSVDLACLVQGSGQTVRHRRALHRILKIQQSHNRRLVQGHNATTLKTNRNHGRLLTFNPGDIDSSGLERVLASAQTMSTRLCDIATEFDEGTLSLETTFNALDDALAPIVDFGNVIDDVLEPVVTVFAEITDALSFLQCPKWLGFICDLDSLVVGIIEAILKAVGLDIDKLITDIVGKATAGLIPDVDIFDFSIPSFNLEPVLVDLSDIVSGLDINPFKDAFTASGVPDITLSSDAGDVGIEFLLATGTDQVEFACETGRGLLAVVLGGSRTTSCYQNYQLVPTLVFPCNFGFEDSNAACSVSLQDITPSCTPAEDPLFSIGAGSIDFSNLVYTCLTREQYNSLETLPEVFRTDFEVGDTKLPNDSVVFDGCPDETFVEIVGLEYFLYNKFRSVARRRTAETEADSVYYSGAIRTMFCDGLNPNITEMLDQFQLACDGGVQSCSAAVLERCTKRIIVRSYSRYPVFLRANYICRRPSPEVEVGEFDVLVSYDVQGKSPPEIISTEENSMVVRAPLDETLDLLFEDWIFVEAAMGLNKANLYFEPKRSHRAITLECPIDRAIYVLQASSGTPGLPSAFDPEFTDETNSVDSTCTGLQICSPDAARHTGSADFKIYKVEYECLCPPGYNLLPDNATASGMCLPCGVGNSRDPEQEECEPCPEGSYSDTEDGQCLACASGTYSSSIGSSSCMPCPAGMFYRHFRQGHTSPDFCMACPLHTYSSTGFINACTPCPAGQKTIGTGSSECIPVDPGEFNDGSSYGPQNCTVGTFSTFAGATDCELCPLGTFAYSEGSAGCRNCTNSYIGACSLCPPSTYADKEGSSFCTPCGGGAYTVLAGAKSAGDCIAPASDDIDFNGPAYKDFSFQDLLSFDLPTDVNDTLIRRRLQQKGNGICNFGPWNTRQGEWDGGDCCPQTCKTPTINNVTDSFVSNYTCTPSMFTDCRDPNVAHYPKVSCTCDFGWTRKLDTVRERGLASGQQGNGICDADLNNDLNDFDGGDCCPDTCRTNPVFPFKSCTEFSCEVVAALGDYCSGDIVVDGLECPAAVTKGTDAGLCFASLPDTSLSMLLGGSCNLERYGWVSPPPNLGLGNTTLTYEASARNTTISPACDLLFTVLDLEKPTIACPPDLTTCRTEFPSDLPAVSDNCDEGLVATLEATGLDALVVGANVLTYRVADEAGNTNSCVRTILVENENSPSCGGRF